MRLLPLCVPLLAIALPGCLSPHSDETRPELQALLRGELPDGWAEGSVAGSYDRAPFWTTFNDLVLNELVVEALEHNHDLVASAERLRAASARSMVSRSARRPQVNAGVNYSRQKTLFLGLPTGGNPEDIIGNTYNQWGAGVDLSWELDLWGKLAAGVEGFDAEFEATYADLQAARLSIAAQVTISWFALRESSEQVKLAEATVETFQSSLQVVQDRFDAGLSGALDLRLSQANVAGSRASLVASLQTQARAARQIEILLGRYPSSELEIAGDFEGLPPEIPAGLPVEILARRPDMVAIERRVASAEAFARQDRLDRWPNLSLTATAGTLTPEFEDILNGDFGVWSFATALAAPLIDGGRRKARIRESLAVVREARAAFASAALRAFFEVENALDSEQRLKAALQHLDDSARYSREATELAQDQYNEGLVSIELVLESQRRQLAAESTFLAARRELYQNRVDLHVALGGAFDAAPELAYSEVDHLEAAGQGDEVEVAEEATGSSVDGVTEESASTPE